MSLAQDRFRLFLAQYAKEAGRGWQPKLAREVWRDEKKQPLISMWATGEREPSLDAVETVIARLQVDPLFFFDQSAADPQYRDYLGRAEVYEPSELDYAAFHEWLETPEGQSATPEERMELRKVMRSDGAPTALAFHYALLSLRSMKPAVDRAVADPKRTDEELAAKGLKRFGSR